MSSLLAPLGFTCAIIAGAYALRIYMAGKMYKGKERIAGKTVIITGASAGIGKETAKELAKRGGRIILACRDMDKCLDAKNDIFLATTNRNIECRKLDLASFASIREFCETINENEHRVDILINNAGVMMCPKMHTEDGIEMQLGVNHMGHFLLTHLLLDKLKASAPSRIIIVSSRAHYRGKINFDDLNSDKSYNRIKAYEQSKLANILHTRELANQLEGTGVTVNCLHPGVVDTELMRHIPILNSTIGGLIIQPFRYLTFKTPLEGAQTTLRLALDSSLENVTGKYFSDCEITEPSNRAKDETAAKKLWALSEDFTKIKPQ